MMEPPQTATGTGPTTGRGWTPRLVLATLCMALVLEALGLGATMIAIALPTILTEFPTTQAGWLTTAYFLAGAISAPLLGKAADLYGKRRVLMLTMVTSGIGALICATAPSFALLVVGRTLQGVILATLSLVPSLIRDVFPPRQAVLASSIVITGMGAFSLIAPLLIGVLLAAGGFRGLFWFDTCWTLLLALAIRLTTAESPLRRQARPDVLGGLLLAAGVAAVLVYVSLGSTLGWVSVTALLLLVGGAVLLALFFRHTKRAAEPIIKLELFRRKPLLFVAIAGATAYAISAATFQLIPLIAMTPRSVAGTYGLGLTTVQYAAIETPKALVSVLGGLLLGYLVSRGRHPRLFLTLGLVAWAVGMAWLAFFNDSFLEVIIGAMIVGLGGGFTVAAVPNLVMRVTPAGDQGSTAGSVQLCQTGFASVLPVVMFAVLAPFATVLPGGSGVVYAEEGLRTWLLIATGLTLVVLIIGVTVLRERRGETVLEFSVDSPAPVIVGAVSGSPVAENTVAETAAAQGTGGTATAVESPRV
jgi:MFS family permease